MSAMKYATIWCDEYPGAELMACGAQVFGDDAKEARENAKRQGWTVNVPYTTPGDGPGYRTDRIRRDYCPEHSRINAAFEDGAVL
jgi:hypothetical protein